MKKQKNNRSLLSENPELSTLAQAAKTILEQIGENPDREGLKKTPERYARALKYFTQGYAMDPKDILGKAVFHENYDEMVVVRDIDFYSLCEHHLVPFFGKAHVAYLPDGKIIGLSKIARLVNIYARRLQVQERMTRDIALALNDHLKPRGVGVIIEATHLCMVMRGVERQNTKVVTSYMLGAFRTRAKTRTEFIKLIE